MKQTKYIEDEDILMKGVSILMKEMGPVDTARFLNMTRSKRMESVKRHREWQNNLDKDEFFALVFSKDDRKGSY